MNHWSTARAAVAGSATIVALTAGGWAPALADAHGQPSSHAGSHASSHTGHQQAGDHQDKGAKDKGAKDKGQQAAGHTNNGHTNNGHSSSGHTNNGHTHAPSTHGPSTHGPSTHGTKGTKGGGHGSPPGNNGTVKIEEAGATDEIPDNNPHVGCQLQVEWYGFDEGADVVSTVSFTSQAPTRDAGITVDGPSQVFVGGDAAGGGTDLDGREVYTLSFTGAPHPKQGYHVKLVVSTPRSNGNDTKSKVFWVEPCTSETTPPGTGTTPPGTGTTPPGTGTTPPGTGTTPPGTGDHHHGHQTEHFPGNHTHVSPPAPPAGPQSGPQAPTGTTGTSVPSSAPQGGPQVPTVIDAGLRGAGASGDLGTTNAGLLLLAELGLAGAVVTALRRRVRREHS